MAARRFAPLATWTPDVRHETRADGTTLVWRADPLGPYPDKITERLDHWAAAAPDRTFLAERDGDGWRHLTYAECRTVVRALGQAFLDLGLSPERPLAILSGNDIEHALMALGAQYVGVPSAALSPAYSLLSQDFSKLRDIAGQLTPGLVFAADGARFGRAIDAVFAGTPVALTRAGLEGRPALRFADLAATEATPAVDAAHAAVGPDTVAKFLFTSGTTGSPKASIQTQRVICSNQEMIADCYAFMREEPPVIVDWAPWNHTAAGNKNFNLVLYNGGTYYLDGGRPTRDGIVETIRNLREISPTWYFNVPAGYEMLLSAMEDDPLLRETFFARLRMMMYAAASMAQHTWDRLNAVAAATRGEPILLSTGYGATETGPFALSSMEPQDSPGNVGIPAQGVTLKLVPHGDKLEARLRGPNIAPGYWRNGDLSRGAFDEEGFYRVGDALRFAVPGDPARGFLFDGRLAENFKLSTGTFVSVGALRAAFVDAMGGLVGDAVIAGEDRDRVAALMIPHVPALAALVPGGPGMSRTGLLAHPAVRAAVAERLTRLAAEATGSATRVARAIFLDDDLSFDRGEVTDKGSINQRAVLRHRADLVAALYGDDPRVIQADPAVVAQEV
ncbi:feruloyl-CoA synthase [Acuticoccus sediminis]|uniref:feruloyl-CoA synthase n=1 Tax=Acuticoccus sediminis TaxID=2184697 RepID=UPI001CFEB958|nr:feruloyl-CoA synthase [Acuticoccus sediminis]